MYKGKYRSLVELVQSVGISTDLIYGVRRGKGSIHPKFIIRTIEAFPGYKFDDLFFVASEKSQ